MTLPDSLRSVLELARRQNCPRVEGRVHSVQGIAIHVAGMRGAIGDLCAITTSNGEEVLAEIVGFAGDRAVVMPLSEQAGIAPWDQVVGLGKQLEVVSGEGLLGRVVDALGRPMDGGPPLQGKCRPVEGSAPPALNRTPITEPIVTGISAIDGLLTIGRGQRIGVFAGSGVGKSTLLGAIARGGAADVNVIALVGERGREVREFIDQVLGPDGMAKSVVVVATSDTPPMQRLKAPFTAVTIAEAFRARGLDVMFMMDSVTRLAGAAREVGLAAGEPPTLRGYPPSLFALLPRLLERLGCDDMGAITGLIAVLVDGDDLNEPVSDALRGYLDGHIVLDRGIAARGRYPAVDILHSVSRLMDKVTSAEHQACARRVRELMAHYEENRDLIQVGAYRKGADPLLDEAVERIDAIEDLLRQGPEARSAEETLLGLQEIARTEQNPLLQG